MTHDEIKKLDEGSKVFLDGANGPYLIAPYGGESWLFYWHESDNHWVILRKVEEGDNFPDNLTEGEQSVYHRLHQEWERRQPQKIPREGNDE